MMRVQSQLESEAQQQHLQRGIRLKGAAYRFKSKTQVEQQAQWRVRFCTKQDKVINTPTIFQESDNKDAVIADLSKRYKYYRDNYIALLAEHQKLLAEHQKLKEDIASETT